MADENIDVRVRLRESAKFNADTRKSAKEVDNLGDQAAQAARKFSKLNREASSARVNLGPFSTSIRRVPVIIGAAALATDKWAGGIISLAEAAATAGGGAAAGGAVGLTALAQGAIVAKLGLDGLGDALGGNEEALKRLTPEARTLFAVLNDAQTQLKTSASTGIMPGLIGGGNAAMRNLPVANKIIGDTAQALGGLAQQAGNMAGSKAWGSDLAKIGGTNVKIIENLGQAGLHLADAGRHILVEAGPLAEWLSEIAEQGAAAAESFFATKRETGELSRFFRDARRDLTLLGSVTGHGSRGLINLFGAGDVDGTRTLRNLDQLMARFERWTNSPAVRQGVGQALVDEIPQLAGPLASAMGHLFFDASGKAAGMFWDGFWDSSAEGKMWLGAAVLWKSGAFKMLGGALKGQLGLGSVPTVGIGPKRAVPVIVMNPGFNAPNSTPTRTPPTTAPPAGGPGPWWMKGIVGATATAGATALALDQAGSWFDKHVLGGGAQRYKDLQGNPVVNGIDAIGQLFGGDDRPRVGGRGNPSPLTVPGAFGNPFAAPPQLPPLRATFVTQLDGREVARNQRQIDLQDKRRRG